MSPAAPAPTVSPSKLLYSGPAGKVWADGAELFRFTARGVRVMSVMPGSPTHQPTPDEMAAVTSAAKTYGKWGPWVVTIAALLVFLGLGALGAPLWVKVLVGLLGVLALVSWPLRRQYQAFTALFGRYEEVTLLLSDTSTQLVSSMVEVGPDTLPQQLGPERQPVAVVVHGLPAPERVKLAGAVMRHVLPTQLQRR